MRLHSATVSSPGRAFPWKRSLRRVSSMLSGMVHVRWPLRQNTACQPLQEMKLCLPCLVSPYNVENDHAENIKLNHKEFDNYLHPWMWPYGVYLGKLSRPSDLCHCKVLKERFERSCWIRLARQLPLRIDNDVRSSKVISGWSIAEPGFDFGIVNS